MFIKRAFDIVASFVGIILLLPLFLVITILIKIFMPGPVLFRQFRTGRYGNLFSIFKFRTMKLDHDGSSISIKGQSRITPLGAVLRKYKLDELPELWNVLKGDMSLVGPRPDLPEYADKLAGEERKILELRPGITGPASLKYVNEEELLATVDNPKEYNDKVIWPDKVRLNLEYYKNRSFSGDLQYVFRTILR
jgi:lipopolysaccharide/colanic/teichoic acid biosynthesis glycosyltransferase